MVARLIVECDVWKGRIFYGEVVREDFSGEFLWIMDFPLKLEMDVEGGHVVLSLLWL